MSGHFYTRGGEQLSGSVIGKNGKSRKVTIKDAREHGWLPGVTTITGQCAKPGLERWLIGEHIRAAVDLGPPTVSADRHDGMLVESFKDYSDRVRDRAGRVGREARETGSEIHESLHRWFTDSEWRKEERDRADRTSGWKGTTVTEIIRELSEFIHEWQLMVEAQDMADPHMIKAINPNVPAWLHHLEDITEVGFYREDGCSINASAIGDPEEAIWRSEDSCVHPMGYATRADLWTEQGGGWLFDFKGVNTIETDATLVPYDEYLMQLAATREAIRHTHGVSIPLEHCRIIYFARDVLPEKILTSNIARLGDHYPEKIEQAWEMFAGLHTFWCAKNNHRPGWVLE